MISATFAVPARTAHAFVPNGLEALKRPVVATCLSSLGAAVSVVALIVLLGLAGMHPLAGRHTAGHQRSSRQAKYAASKTGQPDVMPNSTSMYAKLIQRTHVAPSEVDYVSARGCPDFRRA